MYAFLVSFKIKPDQRGRFLAAAEDDATCSVRDEPGCLRFDVFQDPTDENRYSFYEVYRDEAAFEAHQTYPHYERWRAASAEVIEERGQRILLRPIFPRDPAYWG